MQNASVNSSRKGGGLIARTEDIHFRVQPEIRKQIETAAAASGERLSEYCVRVLISASGYVRAEKSEPGKKTGAAEGMDRSVGSDSVSTANGSQKTASITCRISKQDKAVIEQKAELSHIPVSEYIRRAVLNDSIVVILDGKEIRHQLSKIGTNLNQLAILAHTGKITCVDLADMNRTLKKLLKQVTQVMKRGR